LQQQQTMAAADGGGLCNGDVTHADAPLFGYHWKLARRCRQRAAVERGDSLGPGPPLLRPPFRECCETRRKRKAGAESGGGEDGSGDSGGGGSVSGEAGGDGGGGIPRAAPTAQAPTATAKVRRTRGAASADQPAVEAQADAPAQAPPLAASPPTPEEATQRLRDALASSDEAAVARALEALAGVVMTKATLRSTGAMHLPKDTCQHTCRHHATLYPTGADMVVNGMVVNSKDMPEALRSRAKGLFRTWMTLQ